MLVIASRVEATTKAIRLYRLLDGNMKIIVHYLIANFGKNPFAIVVMAV